MYACRYHNYNIHENGKRKSRLILWKNNMFLWVNDSELINRETLSACEGLDESQGCRICYKLKKKRKKQG